MGMKPCPYCAEQIQDAAIKCRFCGCEIEALDGAHTQDNSNVLPDHLKDREQRTPNSLIFRILLLVMVGAITIEGVYIALLRNDLEESRAESIQALQSAEHARSEAERIRTEPRLLYRGRVSIPAGSYSVIELPDTATYGKIFGTFQAPRNQVVTLRAFREREFLKFKAREAAEGHEWKNVAESFEFSPSGEFHYLVVAQDNVLFSTVVELSAFGKPL